MKVIAISPSALDAIDVCKRRYLLARKHGITLQEDEAYIKADAEKDLDQGNAVHELSMAYYTAKLEGHPFDLEASAEDLRLANALLTDMHPSHLAEAIKVFREYLAYHAHDSWTPLAVEVPFAKVLVEIPDSPEREGITVLLQGRVDLIVRTSNNVEMIVDHKKTSQKRYPNSLSHQAMAYCWALEKRFMCYNYIGFQNSKDKAHKFHRPIVSYTPRQLSEWRYWAAFKAIGIFLDEQNDLEEPNYQSCWKYGRACEFMRICESDPGDRSRQIMSHFTAKTSTQSLWRKENK